MKEEVVNEEEAGMETEKVEEADIAAEEKDDDEVREQEPQNEDAPSKGESSMHKEKEVDESLRM
ncbi:hypothetical protein Dimus_024229, partial [Dionaea muscipula]